MMKLRLLGVFFSALLIAQNSVAKLNILACEPEWKALAEEIGGDLVKAHSATTAFQDAHHIEARPSLIAKARKADLVICAGAELEVGWLPLLIRQSGNKGIQQGQPGYFMASDYVERLDVPEVLDRSMGDIHAEGNPHVHLDPERLLTIASELKKSLSLLDVINAGQYQKNFEAFQQKWQDAIVGWKEKAKALNGRKAIVQHKNWSYLLPWLGIEVVGDLEPKPGVPPSTQHLAKLLVSVKDSQADFIMVAAYQNQKGAKWLSKKSGLPIKVLPFTVGGNEDSNNLFDLYDSTLDVLLAEGT